MGEELGMEVGERLLLGEGFGMFVVLVRDMLVSQSIIKMLLEYLKPIGLELS